VCVFRARAAAVGVIGAATRLEGDLNRAAINRQSRKLSLFKPGRRNHATIHVLAAWQRAGRSGRVDIGFSAPANEKLARWWMPNGDAEFDYSSW
jgi:hypothetical protein